MKWQGELTHQIELKRDQMIDAAAAYGFSSKEALQFSQELDQLMNIYRYICEKGVAAPFFPIYRDVTESHLF